ncbi:uncharacterized protein [Palaemon carinicauda]|uniref:uncharacterized protein n=1 Tax=Palaemon carinicauda TaxID=392227 RepID=UPI0035B59DFD
MAHRNLSEEEIFMRLFSTDDLGSDTGVDDDEIEVDSTCEDDYDMENENNFPATMADPPQDISVEPSACLAFDEPPAVPSTSFAMPSHLSAVFSLSAAPSPLSAVPSSSSAVPFSSAVPPLSAVPSSSSAMPSPSSQCLLRQQRLPFCQQDLPLCQQCHPFCHYCQLRRQCLLLCQQCDGSMLSLGILQTHPDWPSKGSCSMYPKCIWPRATAPQATRGRCNKDRKATKMPYLSSFVNS